MSSASEYWRKGNCGDAPITRSYLRFTHARGALVAAAAGTMVSATETQSRVFGRVP
jgi:hypothetical protein